MKKGSRIVKFFAGSLALFLLWIFVAPLLAENLIVEKSLEHADAILVLGGSATYQERTDKAAELFKKGITAKIYLTDDNMRSGWSKSEQRNIPFVELAQRNLVNQGVPAESIEVVKPDAGGTIYEARSLAQISKKENLKSLLLVTSAYHTRRALRTFERAFAENDSSSEIGVEYAQTGRQTPLPSIWWFSRLGWQSVAGEYVKFVYYWLYY